MNDLPVLCMEYATLDNVRFEYNSDQGHIKAFAIVDGDNCVMYSLIVEEFIDMSDLGHSVMFTANDSTLYYIRSVDKTNPDKQIDAISRGVEDKSVIAGIVKLIY